MNSYSAAPLRLTHLVGGEKISGGSAAVSRNPSDVAEMVAEHPIGDADLLDAAIAAAHHAQAGRADASHEFRSDILDTAGRLLVDRADSQGWRLPRAGGKTPADRQTAVFRVGP